MTADDNTVFPWNTTIDMTANGSDMRAVIIGQEAIHAQLCVVANLLRLLIQEEQP